MFLRNFHPTDIARIREIHREFYQNEFPFPDLDKFISFCVGVDDSGDIISLGGVRTIAELVFITDKTKPTIARGRAFKQMLQFCNYVASKNGKDQLYAHVEGADWIRNLKKAGFKQFKAVPLVLNVE